MTSDPIPAPDKPLDLLDVALFVRAALLSNVSAAGREFGVSAAVASARIAQLERQLGARLLHRTTRHCSRLAAHGGRGRHETVRGSGVTRSRDPSTADRRNARPGTR